MPKAERKAAEPAVTVAARKSSRAPSDTGGTITSKPANLTQEQELHAYGQMLLIRRFESAPARCTAWG